MSVTKTVHLLFLDPPSATIAAASQVHNLIVLERLMCHSSAVSFS